MMFPEGLCMLQLFLHTKKRRRKSHLIGTDIWWFHVSSSHSILLYFSDVWFIFDIYLIVWWNWLQFEIRPQHLFVHMATFSIALLVFTHQPPNTNLLLLSSQLAFLNVILSLQTNNDIRVSAVKKIVTNLCVVSGSSFRNGEIMGFHKRSREFYCYWVD